MAELESLVFSVDTTQLEGAQKKVDALAASVAGLEQATSGLSNTEANAIRTTAEITKAKTELTRANTALTRAEDAATKAAEDKAKALESSSKSTDKAAENTAKLDRLLQNLANTHKDLTEGFSRSESSTLNVARSFGASADYIEKIQNQLKDIGKLTKNPFDASLGAIRSITNELEAMENRAKLADKALFLTSKQLAEYSRITTEAEGKVIAGGFDPKSLEGLAKVNEIADKSRAIYEEKAKALNTLIAAEERSNNEARKTLELQANLNKNNNDAVDSLIKLSQITEMVNSGMSKQEAEYRISNTAKGISKELTDNLIAAEKSLQQAIENQTQTKKLEELQYKNNNAMMDAATQQYYKEKAALEARNSALVAGSSAMTDYLSKLQERTQRDTIAEKYVGQGASRATANVAAKSEMQGVPQSDIDSFVKQAAAMDVAIRKKTELAAANKIIMETEQRLAAALDQTNSGLSQQATDTLVKYSNALKATGVSSDIAASKLENVKNQLEQVASKERAQKLEHLARAISVQMGDIGVSLASGQNPLIVMIQQGDQIRGALDQAGAKGKELQSAMNNAAAVIANGFKNTGIAIGGFVAGAMSSLIDSFKSLPIVTYDYIKALVLVRNAEDKLGKAGADFAAARTALFASMVPALASVGIALTAVTVAAVQTINAQRGLNTALQLQGAALGVSTAEAAKYAESINVAGINSNKATVALTEMINAGVKSRDSIAEITQTAIELEKYGGVALEKTAAQYAHLGKDPVKALAELGIETGYVTEATLKQVEALVEVGKKEEAVKLATEAMQDAHAKAIESMKNQLTPFGELLIEIKGYVTDIWQAFIDLGKSSAIINGLRTVLSSYAAVVTIIVGSVKSWTVVLAGAMDAYDKAKNFDVAGAKNSIAVVNDSLDAIGKETEAKLLSIKTTSELSNAVAENSTAIAKQRQVNSDASASFEGVHKAMKKVEAQSDKLDKKVISKPEYIKMYQKDILEYAQAQNKTGQEVRFTTEQLAKQAEVAGRLWEKEQKKPKAGASSTFTPPPSNIPNLQKEYSSALRLAEQYGKDERAILKMYYDAGITDRGTFIANDLALVTEAERQRRQVIDTEGATILANFEKEKQLLKDRAAVALSSAKDANNTNKINAKLADDIEKVNNAETTFINLQKDKKSSLESDIQRRYAESVVETQKAIKELNKEYKDFVKKQDDVVTSRRIEISTQATLMTMTGAQAAAYKAGGDAAKQMVADLSQLDVKAKDAAKTLTDYEEAISLDVPSQEQLKKYFELYKVNEEAKSKIALANSKQQEYIEKAKIDAVNKYYIEEITRVAESLSGILTTYLFDGKEAGAKALRSYIEQELRKKFTIEIQANLITPLVSQAFASMGLGNGSVGSISGMQMPSFGNIASSTPFTNFALSEMGSKLGLSSAGPDAVKYNILTNTGELASSLDKAGAAFSYASAAFSVAEGKWGQAAGQAIGQWFGGPIGSAIGGKIGSMVDQAFSGEIRKGARYTTTSSGVAYTEGPSGGSINRYTEEQLNKTAFASINSFLKNLGSKDFITQFVSGVETSTKGKGGAFAGGTLSSGAKFGDTQTASAYKYTENLNADQAMQRYTEEMNKVTIAALQAATDIPEYISKTIKNLDVEKLTADQANAIVQDVNNMFTAMKTANKYMRDFGNTLFDTTEKGATALSNLTSQFGGLDQFNNALQTFSSLVSSPFQQALSNYTELKTSIDGLGKTLPYSAEGIRQVTNGLDLSTEAGAKTYAIMIQAGSAMIQAGDALLQTIGTSTEELAGIIVEGMRKGDPAGAGQYFADTVVYGIENALYQNMGSQITQIITNGIVTPLMQSMFAGSTAAEAISKLSIASVTKQVQEVTTFFSSLFSSSEWKSVMSSLQQGLSGLVSSTITSMPAPTFSEPVNPWKEVDKAAKDAEDAAKKAAEEWAKLLETLNDRKRTAEIKTIYLTQGKAAGLAAERAKELSELTKDLNSKQTGQIKSLYGTIVAIEDYNAALEALQKLQEEGKTLEIQLLRALGKEEQSLAKERAIAIKDMSELEIAQYDLNTSTSKLIDQVTNLNSVFKSVFDTLATPEMKATKSYQDALTGIEKETGVKMDRRFVQNFTNEELLKMVGVVSQWNDVSAGTRANLIGFIGQIGELNTAFRETEKEIKSLVVTLSERFMSKPQLAASKYNTLASDIINSNLSGSEKNTLSSALQSANKQTIQDTLLDLFNNDLTQDQKKSLVEIANKLLDYLQQALDDAMSETDKAFSTLTSVADKQIAKLEKSFEVTDNAYAALERAVEAQRKGLEKQIKTAEKTRDTLKEIFDFLTEQIRELRGEVDQTKKMQADEGRRIILEARASGILPTEKILKDSVSAARTGVEDQLYATKQERDRAYLVLANDLEALKNIAGPQLTEAEKQLEIATKQLEGLDDILKKAKDQIDIMRGIDVSILSVDQAMSKLQTAIQAEQEARNQIEYIKKQIELAQAQYDTLREVNQGITDLGAALTNFATAISNEIKVLAANKSIPPNQAVQMVVGTGGASTGPIQPSIGASGAVVPFIPTSTTAVSSNGTPSQTIASNPGMGTLMYQPSALTAPVAPTAPTNYFGSNGAEVHVASGVGYQAGTGLPYVVSEIASLASSMLASGQDQAVIAAIQGQGFTHSQAEAILGIDLPQFADGGSYQGGLALVGEEGPELINFNQPGQIFTAGQTRGLMSQDNSDLVEELQALRQEVQMLRSEARATALNTGKLDRRFDRMTAITANGESLRTSNTPEG